MDGDDILAPIVGRERLISGVAFIASSISKPGTVKHIGTMQRVIMGELEGPSSKPVEKLFAAMIAGRIDAEISDDIERTIWEKFVFLVGMSSTTTLMNSEIGPIRSDTEGREFLHNVFREPHRAMRGLVPKTALGDRVVKLVPNRIEKFPSTIEAIKAIKGFVEIVFLLFFEDLSGFFDFGVFADVVGVCGLSCGEF